MVKKVTFAVFRGAIAPIAPPLDPPLLDINLSLNKLFLVAVAANETDFSYFHSLPLSESVAARLTARVHRASTQLDKMPLTGRATAMQSFFIPQTLPGGEWRGEYMESSVEDQNKCIEVNERCSS